MGEEAPSHIPLEEQVHVEVRQEPSQGQIDESQREQDPARAEAMAYAGDEHRSLGSKYRGIAQGLQSWEAAENNRLISIGFDKQGEILEKWGGILYDHPVSEDYKAMHPEIDFTPKGLVYEEHIAKFSLLDAEVAERYMKQGSISDLLMGSTRYDIQDVISEFKERSRQDSEPKNDSETIDRLKGLFIELYHEKCTIPLKNRARVVDEILDDIRSGRASEGASQDPPQEN